MSELEPFCFWCGGNARYDFTSECRPFREDPKPCAICDSIRKTGVTLYEVMESDPGCGNPPLIPGVWFTGRWTVVPDHQIEHIFPAANVAAVLEVRVACLRADNYKKAHLDHYPWRTIQ